MLTFVYHFVTHPLYATKVEIQGLRVFEKPCPLSTKYHDEPLYSKRVETTLKEVFSMCCSCLLDALSTPFASVPYSSFRIKAFL